VDALPVANFVKKIVKGISLYGKFIPKISPSVPRAVGHMPSLATRANTAVNGLPEHAVVRHLLSVVQARTNN